MHRFRPRLTYANVMATLAVFLGLGGTAWAVAANSVGTQQLKDGAVTAPKLGTGAVGPVKLKNGAVTSAKLAAGAVTAATLAQPKVIRVADNPYTNAAPDPCSQGKIAMFCGSANQFGSKRGWYNWGAPFGPVSFWLDSYGLVHLSGEILGGAPIESAVFILPKGYRPLKEVQFSVARQDNPACGGTCDGNDAVVQVDPNGEVSEPVGYSGDGYSLEGITYPTH